MYKEYKAKTILNIHKHVDGGWFWSKYSANPYIGCEWGCQYCYARDEKYNPHKPKKDKLVNKFEDPFSEYIKIKINAPELLDNSLRHKPKEVIYLDSYMPIDVKYQYARKMLEICMKHNFPVFINEKSTLILRDLDILKQINIKSYLNIGWSIITTKDDKTRKIIESKTPTVKSRFETMKKLSDNNILTGTIFMPIIPFLYDDEENIEAVIRKTKESGGKYMLDGGLTLQGYCKNHFYKTLKKYFPEYIEKYEKLYDNTNFFNEYTKNTHKLVKKYCNKYNLPNNIKRPLNFYPNNLHINKKIAEIFYNNARELQLSGKGGYREWSYRKTAWILDDLEQNIKTIYEKHGGDGFKKIKGIGETSSKRIEESLNNF